MNAELECKVKRKKQKRARNPLPTISLENLDSTFGEEYDPLPCPQELQTSASAECVSKFSSPACPSGRENAHRTDVAEKELQPTGTPENDVIEEAETGREGELAANVVEDAIMIERELSEVSINNNWAAIEIELAMLPPVPETALPDPSDVTKEAKEVAEDCEDAEKDHQDLDEQNAEVLVKNDRQAQEEEGEVMLEPPESEELPLEPEEAPTATSSENELAICDSSTKIRTLCNSPPVEKEDTPQVSLLSDYDDPLLNYKFIPRTRESPTNSSIEARMERLQFQSKYLAMKESIELTPSNPVWSPVLEKPKHVRLVYDYDVLKAMIDDDYAAQRRQQKLQLASNVVGLEEKLGFGSNTMTISEQWRQLECLEAFNLPSGVHSWEPVRKHSDLYELHKSRLKSPERAAAAVRIDSSTKVFPYQSWNRQISIDSELAAQMTLQELHQTFSERSRQAAEVPRVDPNAEPQFSESTKTLPRKSNGIQNVWAEVTFKCRQVWNAVKSVKRRASSLFKRKESGAQEAPLPLPRSPKPSRKGAQRIPEIKLRDTRERASLVEGQGLDLPDRYDELQPDLEWPGSPGGWVLPPKRSERRNSAPGASGHSGVQHSTPNPYPNINRGSTSKGMGTQPKSNVKSSKKTSPAKSVKPSKAGNNNLDSDWLADFRAGHSSHYNGKRAHGTMGRGGWIM